MLAIMSDMQLQAQEAMSYNKEEEERRDQKA